MSTTRDSELADDVGTAVEINVAMDAAHMPTSSAVSHQEGTTICTEHSQEHIEWRRQQLIDVLQKQQMAVTKGQKVQLVESLVELHDAFCLEPGERQI